MSNALTSVRLSGAAMVSAAAGWVSFAIAIRLGNHFNTVDLRSGLLLLIWAVLGPASLIAWIAACVLASRARRENPAGAKTATLLTFATPASWLVEFGLLIIWFGFEVLSGPGLA